MAVSHRVASRYAKSLLSLAAEQKVVDAVKADMDTFLSVCANSRDFVVMLESPVIYIDSKRKIIDKIFQGKLNDLSMKFIDIVVKKHRADGLESIAQEVVAQYNAIQGVESAVVRTAIPLNKGMKGEFEKALGEAIGKKIDLSEKVEEELIGGYILRVNDKQVDQSVKSGLNKLRRNFSSK